MASCEFLDQFKQQALRTTAVGETNPPVRRGNDRSHLRPEIGQPTADLIDVSNCQRYVGQPGGARGPLPFGDIRVGPESEQLDHPAARCNQLHRGHVDGIKPQNAVDDRSALLRPTVFREPEPMAPEAEKSDSANIRWRVCKSGV